MFLVIGKNVRRKHFSRYYNIFQKLRIMNIFLDGTAYIDYYSVISEVKTYPIT